MASLKAWIEVISMIVRMSFDEEFLAEWEDETRNMEWEDRHGRLDVA